MKKLPATRRTAGSNRASSAEVSDGQAKTKMDNSSPANSGLVNSNRERARRARKASRNAGNNRRASYNLASRSQDKKERGKKDKVKKQRGSRAKVSQISSKMANKLAAGASAGSAFRANRRMVNASLVSVASQAALIARAARIGNSTSARAKVWATNGCSRR